MVRYHHRWRAAQSHRRAHRRWDYILDRTNAIDGERLQDPRSPRRGGQSAAREAMRARPSPRLLAPAAERAGLLAEPIADAKGNMFTTRSLPRWKACRVRARLPSRRFSWTEVLEEGFFLWRAGDAPGGDPIGRPACNVLSKEPQGAGCRGQHAENRQEERVLPAPFLPMRA